MGKNYSPIIICGCSKSGTSLLRNLFDGHPELYIVPTESHFFENINYWVNYYTRRKKPQSLSISEMRDNLFNWIVEQNNKGNPLADGFTQQKWDIEILKKYLYKSEPKNIRELAEIYYKSIFKSYYKKEFNKNLRFVEKSVENAEFAQDWLSIFPNAKFIHIIRNPYSNFVAFRKFRTRYYKLHASINSMYNSYYYLYKNKRHIKNYCVIKYEDLLSKPEESMKNISEYLDIEFNESLLRPSLDGELWKGNSTNGNQFEGISQKPLTEWKNRATRQEIRFVNKMFDFVLRDFGYDLLEYDGIEYRKFKRGNILRWIINYIIWIFIPKFREKP